MNHADEILLKDLTIFEEMALDMGEYLKSESLYWTMARGDMPRLTIGGYLMRQHRLSALRSSLPAGEQDRLDAAINTFDRVLVDQLVRFERRAHRELHTFLGEWVGHLRDWTRYKMPDIAAYANAVDTRVVITATVDKLREHPYQLDQRILEEMDVLDRKLLGRWQTGEFVWASVWQPAYPKKEYWWLYGILR